MTLETETISIMIIDDHVILLEALEMVLLREKEFSIVGKANSCTGAVAILSNSQPDVVVLDLRLPDCDGTELIELINTKSPKSKIIILSVDGSIQMIHKTFELGARGYVLKNSGAARLVEAIRKVHDGEMYADGYVSEQMLKHLKIQDVEVSETDMVLYRSLSPREQEVLKLLANGLSTKEIAADLEISPKTVETHRLNLYSKLKLHQPIELTRYAIRVRVIG